MNLPALLTAVSGLSVPLPILSAMDACRSRPGEIAVCGRVGRGDRYRLPEILRDQGWSPDGPIDSVSRERHRLIESGGSGIGSCSNVGPGGSTGCMIKAWRAATQQHGGR